MNRICTRRRSFTLIELLVVVAIVALLISILLPSLSQAREQAKSVKCVANLKQIGDGMNMYFMDHNEWFPYEKRNELNGVHGFYYGGHPGRRMWWGYYWEAWRDTPAGRPFNSYLYPGLPNWDVKQNKEPALFRQVRDLPIYECPADTGGFWNTQTDDQEHDYPLYFETGSSYDFNYHYVLSWAIAYRREPRWLELGNAFLRKQMEFHSSRFVALYEDPFDSAQWNFIPRRGWHRQWNQHNFLFLDGHAASTFADTTKGNRGPGWKTASGRPRTPIRPWYLDQNDPDYEYRDLRPR